VVLVGSTGDYIALLFLKE